ncbi:MAG: hypothetical protein LBU15_02365 [Rickettsiales bacterium]|jgi:hypothetical protein|nr:hypothetical protein [Rickettsiales bacterium]
MGRKLNDGDQMDRMDRDEMAREQRKREVMLRKLLLEQLNIASEELDRLIGSAVAKGGGKKRIVVDGSLPRAILRQLEALGYDVIEMEPAEREERGPKIGDPGTKGAIDPLRTAQILVNARDPDPALAVKNEEAAKALVDKIKTPRQRGKDGLLHEGPRSGGAFGDKFPGKDRDPMASLRQYVNGQRTEKEDPERDGVGGWIDNMSFSDGAARCTIHYRSEAERSALEARAREEMNAMLNEKSYVRQEANREAYPALARERDGPGRGLGIG